MNFESSMCLCTVLPIPATPATAHRQGAAVRNKIRIILNFSCRCLLQQLVQLKPATAIMQHKQHQHLPNQLLLLLLLLPVVTCNKPSASGRMT
jgi:hypothetical protein